MIIPKHHRRFLESIGHPHWFWYPTHDWAFGKRYKFKDGAVAYLFDGGIITIRKGANVLWKREDGYGER